MVPKLDQTIQQQNRFIASLSALISFRCTRTAPPIPLSFWALWQFVIQTLISVMNLVIVANSAQVLIRKDRMLDQL